MLLTSVERFLKSYRIPPTRFGRDAVHDPCFVFDLRDGREPRPATVKRVAAYIEEQDRMRMPAAASVDANAQATR